MNLVKVGKHIINLDNLTLAERTTDWVVLYYAGEGESAAIPFQFKGDAAEQLWAWLCNNAEDVYVATKDQAE